MGTLTATVDADTASVSVSLDWSDVPAVTSATVSRVNLADGSVVPLRNADPSSVSAGLWVGDDFEAPLDEPVYYRAGSTSATTDLVSETVSVPSSGKSWLKHPGLPMLNTRVRLADAPSVSSAVDRGVFVVLGRRNPVTVSGIRQSFTSEIRLLTKTAAEVDALSRLLAEGAVLLLQTPPGRGWGSRYISIGDVSEQRVSRLITQGYRLWDLSAVQVDRPVGAAAGFNNTWGLVESTYATWQAASDTEETWLGMLEGIG